MGNYSGLSDSELRRRIKTLERQGKTGRTNSTLHALNCEQTNRLSTSEIRRLIRQREAINKPTAKLRAALRDRGG
jgi:hypothetical protein